jgi:hypothetical protein
VVVVMVWDPLSEGFYKDHLIASLAKLIMCVAGAHFVEK